MMSRPKWYLYAALRTMFVTAAVVGVAMLVHRLVPNPIVAELAAFGVVVLSIWLIPDVPFSYRDYVARRRGTKSEPGIDA